MPVLRVSILCCFVLLWGCERTTQPTGATATGEVQATQTTASEPAVSASLAASSPMPAPSLDAAGGKEIGLVVEGYLTPHQESNEED